MCFVGLVTLRHAGEAAGPGPVLTARDGGLEAVSRNGALMVCIMLLLDKP